MEVGIVGYGAYVPRFRIKVEEIAKVWGQNADAIKNSMLVSEKSVPDIDEDTVTMSVEASNNAIVRSGIDPQTIGCVLVGSESHPYAVKPSGTILVDALGIGPDVTVVDTEFACRAGSTNIALCMGMVGSGMVENGLAVGADTAQSRPGDALEYTAAAGGAGFIIGTTNLIAKIVDHYSFVTDTTDFFRREGDEYPSHGGRFTGEPAYFTHVLSAAKKIMERNKMTASDFDYVVLHMPNGKFPTRAGKKLGFTPEQMEDGMVVKKIGNTYSGSSLLGLTRVLDIAQPGAKILVVSYGSGAGSDAFIIETTELLAEKQNLTRKFDDYANEKEYIDYGTYVKLRGKLKR